tara:strand:- start:10292 stop:11851 length:1560 start_codon:yes stop_codon:yes gene_type:complete
MKIFCTASKDTYITDKIIDNRLRAEDANVGRAGTLDVFRLWNETIINGSGSQNELSRALIKFDYQKIHELTASKLDLSNFTATLRLFDMKTGHAVPANFNLSVLPLSKAFDEGAGRDIGSFGDLDSCNFITSSIDGTGAAVLWNMSGANAIGDLGAADLDIFDRANFNDGAGLSLIAKSQNFIKGTEDLSVDVTKIVSASVAGQIENHGFRIAFSGSEETDSKSRFVKRFASRHVSNLSLRPKIEIAFDESIQDNHSNFYFDLSGSLFLNSYERSSAANLVSGSALTPIAGTNSLMLKLKTGSFVYATSASQYSRGTIDANGENFLTGVYSVSFAIPSTDTSLVASASDSTLANWVATSGSLTMEEYWYSLDGNVGFHTGSIKINRAARTSGNWTSREPLIQITNLNHEYSTSDEVSLRIFGRDLVNEQNQPAKIPINLKPVIFDEVYYRVRNTKDGKLIIDFGEDDNSTRVSTDNEGMFFDFHMDTLYANNAYEFEFLVIDRGQRHVVANRSLQFVVR